MLAADAELQVGRASRPRSAAIRISSPTPSRSSVTKGSLARMPPGGVGAEEGSRVVARQAEGRLGEVVGAEGEELGGLGDLAGAQRGARQLDHGADAVGDLDAALGRDRRRGRVDQRLDPIELGPWP